MNSSARKKQLRCHYRRTRAELAAHPQYLKELNKGLCRQLKCFLDSHPSKAIAAYYPTPLEPGGEELIRFLSHEISEIWLPISQPKGILEWARYDSDEALAPGKLGIMEPKGPRISTEKLATCDLILVPALACHPSGVRLGQGAGYYDRALSHLAQFSPRPLTVALLHPGEMRDEVPIEPHDQPVKFILTAEGTVATPAQSV